MARIRTVKPDFFRSRTLNEVSVSAQRTFIGLWCMADDDGRYRYEPALLRADVWPLAEDVTAKQVDGWIDELERGGVVCRYESAGKTYLHVVNWHEHQKINRPTPSSLPECSRSAHGTRRESSPQEVEVEVEREEEEEGEQKNVVAFRADIDALCNLLADAVQINTGERPKIGKTWHEACRLLLDRDGYTAEQVEALIRWSQADEFWRSNILSMTKLREKRLTLIGQMQRGNHSRPTSRLLAEDAKLAHWAQTLEGGEHAAERMAPHRSPARRELPRPGTPG